MRIQISISSNYAPADPESTPQTEPSDEEVAERKKREQEAKTKEAKEEAKKPKAKPGKDGPEGEEGPVGQEGEDAEDTETDLSEGLMDEVDGDEDAEDSEESEEGDEESEDGDTDSEEGDEESEDGDTDSEDEDGDGEDEKAEASSAAESIIVSGFPGTGKSTFVSKLPTGYVSDSDSSTFPKDQFPQNYLTHIKGLMASRQKFILVSSHTDIRNAMVAENIPFILVYPTEGQLEEYLRRYRERGSPDSFLEMVEDNWYEWIQECREQKGCRHVILGEGEYLSDGLANFLLSNSN